MPISINNKNYQEYKKIYEIIVRNQYKSIEIPDAFNPINILNNWEKQDFKIAKLGLKEGLRDCITSLKQFPKETYYAIQNELELNRLPSLIKLIGLTKDTIKKVSERQKIKNVNEYYVVKEFVIDLSSEITDEQRTMLDKYLMEFELKEKKIVAK